MPAPTMMTSGPAGPLAAVTPGAVTPGAGDQALEQPGGGLVHPVHGLPGGQRGGPDRVYASRCRAACYRSVAGVLDSEPGVAGGHPARSVRARRDACRPGSGDVYPVKMPADQVPASSSGCPSSVMNALVTRRSLITSGPCHPSAITTSPATIVHDVMPAGAGPGASQRGTSGCQSRAGSTRRCRAGCGHVSLKQAGLRPGRARRT